MKNRQIQTLNLNGWTVNAVIIKEIAGNLIVFYAQNRIAIYSKDTKATEIIEEYVVIPEYDEILNNKKSNYGKE